MTVVLARRFEDSICILSDTMISDAGSGKENAIPGRLKIVMLAPDFTVAYAGHADPALHAIKEARRVLIESGPDIAIEHLRAATENRGPADFDFLVALHRPEAELRRVWGGIASDNLDQAAIGDSRIRSEVERRFDKSNGGGLKDYHAAFIGAFTDRKIRLGTGVGGFPICLFATPQGHAYRGHSFGHSWKPIIPKWGTTTYEDEYDLLTGEWSFHHSVLTADRPGVAILGVEIPQAKVGYVYAPLFDDDPIAVKLLDDEKLWTQHQAEIHAALRQAISDKLNIIESRKPHAGTENMA